MSEQRRVLLFCFGDGGLGVLWGLFGFVWGFLFVFITVTYGRMQNTTKISLNIGSTWEAGPITATGSLLFADQSCCSHLQQ